MGAHPVRRRPRALLLLTAVLVIRARRLLGARWRAAAARPSAAPEKPQLRLGVLPIVDVAHLQHAQAAGYFAAEGLTVELVTVQGGAAALPRLATAIST